MLTRLQVETRALHPDADALWIELMSIDDSFECYVAALIATYGFEAPMEAAIAMTPGVTRVIDLRERMRSCYIVQDLLALGYSPRRIARLPQCCAIIPFRDTAEALGWLYVIERATLLHDAVRRMLAPRLPNIAAWSYLAAYDGLVGERWQQLGRVLDTVATSPGIADRIVDAANAAFRTMHHWNASDEAHSERLGAYDLS